MKCEKFNNKLWSICHWYDIFSSYWTKPTFSKPREMVVIIISCFVFIRSHYAHIVFITPQWSINKQLHSSLIILSIESSSELMMNVSKPNAITLFNIKSLPPPSSVPAYWSFVFLFHYRIHFWFSLSPNAVSFPGFSKSGLYSWALQKELAVCLIERLILVC